MTTNALCGFPENSSESSLASQSPPEDPEYKPGSKPVILNNREMLLRKDPSFRNFVTIKPTILLEFCLERVGVKYTYT
jgi:hypothetical protein